MGDARSCSTFSALASPNLRASAAMPGHILTGATQQVVARSHGEGRKRRRADGAEEKHSFQQHSVVPQKEVYTPSVVQKRIQ